jgi:DNA-binding transcriptional LysR family regulator
MGPMIDVRRLQVFSVVVDTGSITAAAAELGFTPSSVSQQMSALERETGVALFEKNGRGIRPTDAGLMLAEHAQAVARAVAGAEAALADVRDGRTGRVRILSFTSAGDALLPSAVAHLHRTHPDLAVITSFGENEDAVRLLRDSEIDVALVLEPFPKGEAPADSLVRVHLLDDPYRAMLPVDHPLAAHETVDLTELADEDWVAAVGANSSCHTDTISICRRAGFSPRFVAHALEFPAAQAYVATGIGVGLIPELALGTVHEGVVIRPLRSAPEPRHVWAAVRPAVAGTASVTAAVKALKSAAREHERRAAARPHALVPESV